MNDQVDLEGRGLNGVAQGAKAAELEAFALDMMGAADTLELLADDYARRMTGVANEMARQIRDRATFVLAHSVALR